MVTSSGSRSPRRLACAATSSGDAEQQAAGDASVGARDRGPQGTGFGPFGQDDERVGRSGLLHHLVTEGGGGEPAGPRGLARDCSQDASSASAMVLVTPSIRSPSSAGSPGSRSRTRVAVW